MQQYTIEETLGMTWSGYEYHVYLFRHGEETLYVGQSTHPILRIKQHTHNGSKLKIGMIIRENMPESLNWLVEIYRLPECGAFVQMHQAEEYETFLRCQKQWGLAHHSALIAERALIIHYRPTHNYKPGRYSNGQRIA